MSFCIRHRVVLDLSQRGHQVTIPFSKADTVAHEIVFSFRYGSTPVALPSGTVAAIFIHNGAEGSGVADSCIVNHVDGTVIYTPTPEALSIAGNISCDMRIMGEGGASVGTPKFIFAVDDTEMDETESEVDIALKANADAWGIIQKTEENAMLAAASAESAANDAADVRAMYDELQSGGIAPGPGAVEQLEEYDGSVTVDEGASVTFEEDYTEGYNDGYEAGVGAVDLGEYLKEADADKKYLAKQKPTEGLAYELSTDGTYYSCVGIGTATDRDIIIASEIDGVPVTHIGDNAFSYLTDKIKSITIASSIIEIGSLAFDEISPDWIFIPKSVKTIKGQLSLLPGYQPYVFLCEAPIKPSGWAEDWNYNLDAGGEISVVWNYLPEFPRIFGRVVALENKVSAQIGDIDTALDSIIAIQESLIGGES